MGHQSAETLSKIDLGEEWLIKKVLSSSCLRAADLSSFALVCKQWNDVVKSGIEEKWTEEMKEICKTDNVKNVLGSDYQPDQDGRLGYIKMTKDFVHFRIQAESPFFDELQETFNIQQRELAIRSIARANVEDDLSRKEECLNNLLRQFVESLNVENPVNVGKPGEHQPHVNMGSEFGMEIIEEARTHLHPNGNGWKRRLTGKDRAQISFAYREVTIQRQSLGRIAADIENRTDNMTEIARIAADQQELVLIPMLEKRIELEYAWSKATN